MSRSGRRLPRVVALIVVSLAAASWAQPPETPATQPATQPAASAPIWLRVTAQTLNLRASPDANSLVVARVDRDTLLQAVDKDPYGWHRVVPPAGVFSLVSRDYVDQVRSAEGVVSVRSGTLRVRAGSSVVDVDPDRSPVQTRLRRGDRVEIIGENGAWLRIRPPDGVYVYASDEHVTRISDEVAQALLAQQRAAALTPDAGAQSATRPSSEPISPDQAPPVPPAGPWSDHLRAVETAILAEAQKPPLEQAWDPHLAALEPIARQQQDAAASRLAQAWIETLNERSRQQATMREAQEILRKAARDRASHQLEMRRIEEAIERATTQPAFAARGELLLSDALGPDAKLRWLKLRDPLSEQIIAYVTLPAETDIDLDRLLGRYVGVHGTRQRDERLGADVIAAEQIVVLRWQKPTTQPARQGT